MRYRGESGFRERGKAGPPHPGCIRSMVVSAMVSEIPWCQKTVRPRGHGSTRKNTDAIQGQTLGIWTGSPKVEQQTFVRNSLFVRVVPCESVADSVGPPSPRPSPPNWVYRCDSHPARGRGRENPLELRGGGWWWWTTTMLNFCEKRGSTRWQNRQASASAP